MFSFLTVTYLHQLYFFAKHRSKIMSAYSNYEEVQKTFEEQIMSCQCFSL